MMMELLGAAGVVFMRQRGASSQRAGSHASHARSNRRTGALSRSTPVPLPNWGAQQASQWGMRADLWTWEF